LLVTTLRLLLVSAWLLLIATGLLLITARLLLHVSGGVWRLCLIVLLATRGEQE
jgi:hypothetical protein